MNHLDGRSFVHYLILFGSQASIWTPLMDFFGGNVVPTLVAWFIISVVIDKMLFRYFRMR